MLSGGGAAIAADTSSPAAATIPVVGAAAAALAAVSVEPILATSVAADAIISGFAITNDISHLQADQGNPRSPSMRSCSVLRIVRRTPAAPQGNEIF